MPYSISSVFRIPKLATPAEDIRPMRGDRPGDAATHWCHRRRGQRSGSAECMSRATVAKSTRHSSGDHPKQKVSIGVFLRPD
uniref:Uncharacterized protein n=1 Tax=Oryza rufipogon TaxID=4529 RepID=A0A0E0QQR9_ORYRU